MTSLPPIPPYEGLHPIVVHFPIALLLTAPLFVVVGLLWRGRRATLFIVAAALAALGTAAAFLAVSTGEEASDAAEQIPAAKATLERHEELAELSRNLFAGVTALTVALAFAAWRLRGRMGPRAAWGAGIAVLAVHAGAALVLANAAHEGGRLVHVYGVHAPTGSNVDAAAAPRGGRDDERDDD